MSISNALEHLEPKSLWENFALICNTPRPSGYMEKISNVMESFGKKLNLETIRDKTGNVIIKKPASVSERAHEKAMILQAHLDMVPQAVSDTEGFDFKEMPIEPLVHGDWVTAKNTTLGADNGIGVAMIMSVLSSTNIQHGPIEAVFTVEEETNQAGVENLANDILTGDTLINLDTESDHHLCIGSAGGVKTHVKIPYMLETVDKHDSFRLSISELKGGHSGCDIVHTRANAIKLLARLLWQFQHAYDVRVARIYGGSPIYNAIPRESYALITLPRIKTKHLLDALPIKKAELAKEYQSIEKDIQIELQPVQQIAHAIERGAQQRIISSLFGCPNGVMHMSTQMPNVPETSSSVGYISTQKDHVTIFAMQRSLISSAKEAIANQVQAVFELAGGQVQQVNSFPCWTANPDAPIVKKTTRIYQQLFKKSPHVLAVHAGLECGFFKEKYPDLDIISIGPNITNPHSPSERVSISSVQKVWKFLCTILEDKNKQ
jgi:dipeptidase D